MTTYAAQIPSMPGWRAVLARVTQDGDDILIFEIAAWGLDPQHPNQILAALRFEPSMGMVPLNAHGHVIAQEGYTLTACRWADIPTSTLGYGEWSPVGDLTNTQKAICLCGWEGSIERAELEAHSMGCSQCSMQVMYRVDSSRNACGEGDIDLPEWAETQVPG